MDRDRNLLFGVLAVQLRRVSPGQLVEAAALWLAEPSKPLSNRLIQLGALTPADRAFLDSIVENTLHLHGDDSRRAYTSIAGPDEWQKMLSLAPASEALHSVSTMLGMPLDVRDVRTGSISAVDETPGRYSHTSEYARGGMGRILLVHDQYLDRDIALKELLPFDSFGEDEPTRPPDSPVRASANLIGRFLREARVTGQLEHPSIVPVYELGRRPNGTLYYTMKLVRGQTLSRAIHEADSLHDRLKYLSHVIDLCQAMAYAHSRHVVHRDIKPSNVMIGGFGETVVIDWGLAKIIGQEDIYAENLRTTWRKLTGSAEIAPPETDTGAALGTPHYMSPEQASGVVEDIDERSDVYALGAVLYELLTGKIPFQGRTTQEILHLAVHEGPRPVREAAPDVPQELAGICSKAMAKDPKHRYQSAKDLADDLIRFQTGTLVKSYAYSPRELLIHYYRKHRAIWHTAAAGLAALCIVAVVSYVNILNARNREHHQRIVAEHARDAESEARQAEQEAREAAEQEGYVAQIRLAQELVEDRNFEAAKEALWATPPKERHWEWGYLLNACHQDLYTLANQTDIVRKVLFSPNGSNLLTLPASGRAMLARVADGETMGAFDFPETFIESAAFSPDGGLIAFTLDDGTARLCDSVTGGERSVLRGHSSAVYCVAFSPDGNFLATGGQDKSLRIWQGRDGTPLRSIEGASDAIGGLSFSANGRWLMAEASDGSLVIYRVPEFTEAARFDADFAALAPEGDRLAIIKGTGVAVVGLPDGTESFARDDSLYPLTHVAFDHDGARLVTASADGVARVYDLDRGVVLHLLNHGESIRSATFDASDSRILTYSSRGLFVVWDAAQGYEVNRMTGHTGNVRDASFSMDGRVVATAGEDRTIRVFPATPSLTQPIIARHTGAVRDGAFDPTGARYATISWDQTAAVVEASTGAVERVFGCLGRLSAESVDFSPDGAYLATVLDEYSPCVWNIATGELRSILIGYDGPIQSIRFSPDGTGLACASWNSTVCVWDPATGSERLRLNGHADSVNTAEYSPDGSRIVSASADGTARVWDASSGAPIATLDAGAGPVTCAQFSGGNDLAVTGAKDGSIRLWDIDHSEARFVVRGRPKEVGGIAVTEDGRRLFATYGTEVMIIDVVAGRRVATIESHIGSISTLRYDPREHAILVSSREGIAQVWRIAPWTTPSDDASVSQTRDSNVAVDANDVPLHVLVADDRLMECMREWQQDIAQVTEVALTDEIVLANAIARHATAPLCLRPGDRLISLGMRPVRDKASFASAIVDAIALIQRGHPLTSEVRRDQRRLKISWIAVPRRETQLTGTPTIEQWRAEALHVKQSLEQSRDVFAQVNHDFSIVYGFDLAPRAISGFFLPSATATDDRDRYLRCNVVPHERVVAVNGRALESLQQLDAIVEQALNLPAETDNEWTITVERGGFERRRIVVRVR